MELTIPVWQDKNIPLSYAVSPLFSYREMSYFACTKEPRFQCLAQRLQILFGCARKAADKFPFSLSSGSVRVGALLTKTNQATEEDALPAQSGSLRLLVSSPVFCRYLHQLASVRSVCSAHCSACSAHPFALLLGAGRAPKPQQPPRLHQHRGPPVPVGTGPSPRGSPSAGPSFRKPKETNAQEHGGSRLRKKFPHAALPTPVSTLS